MLSKIFRADFPKQKALKWMSDDTELKLKETLLQRTLFFTNFQKLLFKVWLLKWCHSTHFDHVEEIFNQSELLVTEILKEIEQGELRFLGSAFFTKF